jgi:hypothetical protein
MEADTGGAMAAARHEAHKRAAAGHATEEGTFPHLWLPRHCPGNHVAPAMEGRGAQPWYDPCSYQSLPLRKDMIVSLKLQLSKNLHFLRTARHLALNTN